MAAEIHKYDEGTALTIQIKDCEGIVDLATATVMQIIFKKPNNTSSTVTATLVTDGSDGKIRYITQEDDLNVVGMWLYEAYIELGGGKWHSDVGSFRVYENI